MHAKKNKERLSSSGTHVEGQIILICLSAFVCSSERRRKLVERRVWIFCHVNEWILLELCRFGSRADRNSPAGSAAATSDDLRRAPAGAPECWLYLLVCSDPSSDGKCVVVVGCSLVAPVSPAWTVSRDVALNSPGASVSIEIEPSLNSGIHTHTQPFDQKMESSEV